MAEPVQKLQIKKINLHPSTQVRARIDTGVVDRYAELIKEGTEFPPVDVFRDDADAELRFYLADGFHRVRAYVKLERATIPARVHVGSRDDALWFALGANRTHGLRLGAGDVRRAVKLALEQKPDASQRVIASHVGCSHRYVGEIRKDLGLEVGTTTHLAERTVGADGKSYPARKPRGKATKVPASSASPPAAPATASPDSGSALSSAATEPSAASIPTSSESSPDPAPAASPAPSVGPLLPLLPPPESGEAGPPAAAVALDSNVIVSAFAMTVASVTAQHDDNQLIVPTDVDRKRLPAWVESIRAGRREFDEVLQVLEPLLERK